MGAPRSKKRKTATDLFCGAGGMALGLQQAGIEIIFAADEWKAAIEAYTRSIGAKALQVKIDWDTALPMQMSMQEILHAKDERGVV